MSDYRHALSLAIGTTAAVIGFNFLLMPEKGPNGTPLPLLSVLWVFAVVPSILCLGSVMSAAGRPWTIAMNLFVSVLVWIGLAVAMFFGVLIAA